jgi:hypothetical protein
MGRPIRLLSSLVLIGVLLAPAARAEDAPGAGVQRVGVLRLQFDAGVPEGAQDMFGQRLQQGLRVAGFEVLAGRRLRDRLRQLGGCAEPRCYPDTARALGVGYLVVGQVTEQSKSYGIALELINGRTGATIASVREQCETCGIEEAGEKMDLAASALRARLEAVTRLPARFVIRSRPADARASIDGRAVGRTPLDLELSGGEHHLSLDLGGHEALNRTFIVVSGVDEALDFDLVEQPSSFPYRTVGWTALTVGALTIAAGVVALAIDGKEISCAASAKDGLGHCPRVRATNVLGAVLLGAGSALGTAGGVSLYLGNRGGTSPEPSAQRPFGIAYNGTF